MLNFTRPTKPDNFDEDAAVELAKVAAKHNQQNPPNKLKFTDSFWGKYKSFFMKAQFRKCGYCEAYVADYGDIEHYRPKSIVQEIKQEGVELTNLHNVRGRKFTQVCKYGYWWLAYDWNNYLLSCKLCNQPWKKALFPISGERPASPGNNPKFPYVSPDENTPEVPLLINPYETQNIASHLDFTEAGLIKPYNGSEMGLQTIKTCGLARDGLIQFRNGTARRAFRYMKRFAQAEPDSEQELEAAEELLELGHPRESFAGMVRIIFEHNSGGFTWQELEDFVEQSQ